MSKGQPQWDRNLQNLKDYLETARYNLTTPEGQYPPSVIAKVDEAIDAIDVAISKLPDHKKLTDEETKAIAKAKRPQ